MCGDPARRGKPDDQGDFYRFIVYDYTRDAYDRSPGGASDFFCRRA
jgi:hypothetical protein